MTHEYQRVPSTATERVATEFNKDVCVITCYDRTHQKTHTTCWGRTPNDKAAAAGLGKILAAAAGANVERTSMERGVDDVDKAEYASSFNPPPRRRWRSSQGCKHFRRTKWLASC